MREEETANRLMDIGVERVKFWELRQYKTSGSVKNFWLITGGIK